MKNSLLLSAVALLCTTFLLSSCKKDSTPPTIALNGSASQTLSLNSSYSDPGATATDDKDAGVAVTSDITATNPNMNLTGTYTITYTAADKAGNSIHAVRTVTVKNDADYLIGSYKVSTDNGTTWNNTTITSSTTGNKKIVISDLGSNLGHCMVTAIVQGSSVTIPNDESIAGLGASGCTHVFSNNGVGTYSTDSQGIYRFSLKYIDTQMNSGASCPAMAPAAYEAFFMLQ